MNPWQYQMQQQPMMQPKQMDPLAQAMMQGVGGAAGAMPQMPYGMNPRPNPTSMQAATPQMLQAVQQLGAAAGMAPAAAAAYQGRPNPRNAGRPAPLTKPMGGTRETMQALYDAAGVGKPKLDPVKAAAWQSQIAPKKTMAVGKPKAQGKLAGWWK